MPGSGAAIAAGTMLDSIPESLILGFAAHQGAQALPPIALIGAFAMGNFAEGLSSAAGMRGAGRSALYIFTLWSGAAIATTLAAVFGYWIFALGVRHQGILAAFAAGSLIALVAETMVPEAVAGDTPFAGVLTTAGFILFLYALDS
jgi:ZIP family zinc transporter